MYYLRMGRDPCQVPIRVDVKPFHIAVLRKRKVTLPPNDDVVEVCPLSPVNENLDSQAHGRPDSDNYSMQNGSLSDNVFKSTILCGLSSLKSELASTSDYARGCGGVGVIWRRSLCCTTISSSVSDRVCGIRIKRKNSQQFLSVIAVYLPCADLGADYYRECLVELERITEESKQLGPTIIMGDFNAHLGTLGGPRGCGDPNSQGVLLHELLQRCDLFVASLSNHAKGPDYTFWRGDTHTTVDYVLMDVGAASIMSSCIVHEVACLNTSDHLPLSVTMDVPTDSIENANDNSTRIDWTKAELSGAISSFQAAVTEKVNPLIDSMHDNIDSINAEIQLVTKHIADAANRTLPLVMPRKRRFFRDATLKQICDKSKVAWKA